MDYSPNAVPTDLKEIPRFLAEELQRLANELYASPARTIEFLDVAPAKPREGMLYGADGTNWNPGSGKGVYCYYGAAWTKL